MPWKNIKLVERSDDEPAFNSHNKTDRKILGLVIVSVVVSSKIIVTVISLVIWLLNSKSNTFVDDSVGTL